jgi:hypothetical protein
MTEKEIELREIARTNLINNISNDLFGNPIQYTDEELDLKVDEIINYEKNNIIRWSELRQERNRRLLNCDWTQIADAPITEELRAEWTTYRRVLRDLPANTEFPAYVDFPRFPGEVRPEDEGFITDTVPGKGA